MVFDVGGTEIKYLSLMLHTTKEDNKRLFPTELNKLLGISSSYVYEEWSYKKTNYELVS